MDVQLIRESIALERPIGTGRAQAVVEGDVMLPGGLREETHILLADAMAVVENAEAMQDRVSVGGRVVFHVLYTQGDPSKVNVIETAQDFMHLCELPGSQARAAASARAWMEKVDARVVNGRLFLRGEIGLQVQALSQTPVEAIVAVNGSDDAEVRTVQSSIRRTVAHGSSDVLLREEFELPEGLEITETFCAAAYPTLSDVSGGMGRRLALARVLALESKLLLLDEPFAGVDPNRAARILARLKAFGVPVLLVSHEERVVAMADRVVELDGIPLRQI